MSIELSGEQQAILQDLVDGETGGGLNPDTGKPKANAYNHLFNLLGGEAGPNADADPAVWNWTRGVRNILKLGLFSALTLGLSACNSNEPVSQTDWQDRSIFVQVGEIVYELAPGPAYALDGLRDKQINAALSTGKGVRASPLKLRSFRIGRRQADSRGLDYDVSIANLEGERGSGEAVVITDPATTLSLVDFNQSPDDVSGETYEGSATFRFSNARLIERPVRCSVVLIGEEIRNVFCSVSGLEYRGNRIVLRARDGSAADVASDFENGLKLISGIERN